MTKRYLVSISMYWSPIRTNWLSTRCPDGFVGSNAKLMPLTWRNRPSNFGYWDTPFSSAAIISRPESTKKNNFRDKFPIIPLQGLRILFRFSEVLAKISLRFHEIFQHSRKFLNVSEIAFHSEDRFSFSSSFHHSLSSYSREILARFSKILVNYH